MFNGEKLPGARKVVKGVAANRKFLAPPAARAWGSRQGRAEEHGAVLEKAANAHTARRVPYPAPRRCLQEEPRLCEWFPDARGEVERTDPWGRGGQRGQVAAAPSACNPAGCPPPGTSKAGAGARVRKRIPSVTSELCKMRKTALV